MSDFVITSTSGIATNVAITGATTTAQAISTGDAINSLILQAVDIDVFMRFGDSTVAACSAANSLFKIPAGQVACISVRPKQTHFTAFSTGTGTLKWWLG